MIKRIISIMKTNKRGRGLVLVLCILTITISSGIIQASEKSKNDEIYEVSADDKSSNTGEAIFDTDKNESGQSRYSEYEKYGLKYDEEQDKLMYNGKVVRFFQDIVNSNDAELSDGDFSGEIRQHITQNGEIDLYATRDSKGILTSLKQSTNEEFDVKTKEWEQTKSNEGSMHK